MGEAVGGPDRRLMRGAFAGATHLRAAAASFPLVRLCGAAFPMGEGFGGYFIFPIYTRYEYK